MRTQTNPGDSGSESLAISISDELARIRYMIALQRGTTFWYGTKRAGADGLNYFRNSDMLNFSRQGQASKNYTASAGSPYTADCFYVFNGANQALAVNVSVPINASKSLQSLQVTRVGGQTGIGQMWIGQPFTLAQISPLRGQQVCVSFDCFFGSTFSAPNLIAQLWTGTGANAAKQQAMTGGVAQTLLTQPAVASTGARVSGVATIPSNATQMDVIFSWIPVGTAAADDSLRLADVKLEVGNQPTPYVNPDPLAELEELAFFYWKTFQLGVAPAQNAGQTAASFVSQTVPAVTGQSGDNVLFTRRMRITPTITFFNPLAANAQARNTSISVDCSASLPVLVNESGLVITFTSAAGSVAGQANAVHITAEAGI
jgi:hypothetical protein